MTREEASEIVESAFDAWENEYSTGDDWSKEHEARDMAIKALEQKPCEDAISRQAVLELVADYDLSMGQVVKGIHELPQQKTGHWIPVSEKLPDKEGYYLCSVRYMYPPYNFFEPEKVKYMDDVTIQKFDGEFNIEVKAWMPLPPCYKPQESEE